MNFFNLCDLGIRLAALFHLNTRVVDRRCSEIRVSIVPLSHNSGVSIGVPCSWESGMHFCSRGYGETVMLNKQRIMRPDSEDYKLKSEAIAKAYSTINNQYYDDYVLNAFDPYGSYVYRIKNVLEDTKKQIKALSKISKKVVTLNRGFDKLMPMIWDYPAAGVVFANQQIPDNKVTSFISGSGVLCTVEMCNVPINTGIIHRADEYKDVKQSFRVWSSTALSRLHCEDKFIPSVICNDIPFDLSDTYKDMLETVHAFDDYQEFQHKRRGASYTRILNVH